MSYFKPAFTPSTVVNGVLCTLLRPGSQPQAVTVSNDQWICNGLVVQPELFSCVYICLPTEPDKWVNVLTGNMYHLPVISEKLWRPHRPPGYVEPPTTETITDPAAIAALFAAVNADCNFHRPRTV